MAFAILLNQSVWRAVFHFVDLMSFHIAIIAVVVVVRITPKLYGDVHTYTFVSCYTSANPVRRFIRGWFGIVHTKTRKKKFNATWLCVAGILIHLIIIISHDVTMSVFIICSWNIYQCFKSCIWYKHGTPIVFMHVCGCCHYFITLIHFSVEKKKF